MTNICSSHYNDSGGNEAATHFDNSIPHEKAKLTMTVDELARQLNVSRSTAYTIAQCKDFYPAIRIGKRIVVSVRALTRWLDEQTEG